MLPFFFLFNDKSLFLVFISTVWQGVSHTLLYGGKRGHETPGNCGLKEKEKHELVIAGYCGVQNSGMS